jgi:GNAT superfamily N-acetyltransferase
VNELGLELIEPTTDEDLAAYWSLRYERLRKDLGLPPGSERVELAEDGSTHLVAKSDGRVVGAACWAVGMHPGQPGTRRQMYVRFRQLAVDPEFEGRGIGGRLTRYVEDFGRRIGATEVVGNVRSHNVAMFEHMGWEVRGPGEPVHGMEHVAMARPLL